MAKQKNNDERINFLVDSSTREELIKLAEANNRTLSNYLRNIVQKHLSTQKTKLNKVKKIEKNSHL